MSVSTMGLVYMIARQDLKRLEPYAPVSLVYRFFDTRLGFYYFDYRHFRAL